MSFTIDDTTVKKGENTTIKIDIADLATGTKIYLPVHVFRAEKEGPTMLVMAGMHGDEVNGVEIVRRLLVDKIFENMDCGSVICIPLLNIYGFINFSRAVPDGKDVNRSFPGSSKGSLASRVANLLTKSIIPLIDVAADFHTGGASRYNFPQIRYSNNDPNAEALAQAFGAPYLICNSPLDHSFRYQALKTEKTVLIFEGGESLRYDEASCDEAIRGMKRFMNHLKMTNVQVEQADSITIVKSHWQRAEVAGLYIWKKSSGAKVKKGDELGSIHDPHATYEHIVHAKYDGYIIGHNNSPIVNQGDALFHIGIPE